MFFFGFIYFLTHVSTALRAREKKRFSLSAYRRADAPIRGVEIAVRFSKSPQNECYSLQFLSFAMRRCRRISRFSTDKNPCVPAKSPKRRWASGGGRRAISVFQNAEEKKKKTPSSLPVGKMAKKVADRKAAERHPRRFRSLRPPTLYRNKPNVPYQDNFRFLVDLSYKIKYFFKKAKKIPFFSPLSAFFTCIFITYIV